jgi:transcriptional regulator with XRE-family HTH domain
MESPKLEYTEEERKFIIKKLLKSPRNPRHKEKCDSPVDIYLGKKLKEIRTSLGISRDELGELVGIASQQIYKYETGKNRISASRLYEFSQILQKPFYSFLQKYEVDRDYYNFVGREESELLELEKRKHTESLKLVNSFNKIKNSNVRKGLVELVESIYCSQDNKIYE